MLGTTESRERVLAQLYDWEHDDFIDDVNLYIALAQRTGGPVLELACGTGRILAALSRGGVDVVGLDCSATALDRAAARLENLGSRVKLVQGDLNGDLPRGPFGLVVLALSAFGFAPDRYRQIALGRRIADALGKGGVAVLDLVAAGALEGQPQGVPILQRTGYCSAVGAHVTKWVVQRVSPAAQTIELSCFYDLLWDDGSLSRCIEIVSLRYFSRYEVELLLECGGLRLEGLYGDYDLGPLTDESERMIVLAVPAS